MSVLGQDQVVGALFAATPLEKRSDHFYTALAKIRIISVYDLSEPTLFLLSGPAHH